MTLVVHPHLHLRYSGTTRHVETIVPALGAEVEARALGVNLDASVPRIGWWEVVRRARREPVVWHAHTNNEMALGLLLRWIGKQVRLVFTRHTSHRPSGLTRALARRADLRVSLTPEIALAFGLPSTVVGHGVDLGRFSPPGDRDEAFNSLGLGGRYGIGVVGRIRPPKGQGDFVEAVTPLLDAHPDWRAVLVGRALVPDRRWAESLQRASGGRLRLAGEQADVRPWYRGLTILVQPSHAEGLSLAFLEGLACGCCVVATRVSDFPRLVEDGRTGFLYEPGDARALREILEALMRDPSRARTVGLAAAEEARRSLGVEHEARALARLYRDLLALPRGAA